MLRRKSVGLCMMLQMPQGSLSTCVCKHNKTYFVCQKIILFSNLKNDVSLICFNLSFLRVKTKDNTNEKLREKIIIDVIFTPLIVLFLFSWNPPPSAFLPTSLTMLIKNPRFISFYRSSPFSPDDCCMLSSLWHSFSAQG